MDLDVVRSASVPFPPKGGDVCTIAKPVTGLIGEVSFFRPSASYDIYALTLGRSNDDKALTVGKNPPIFRIARHTAIPLSFAASGLPSDGKSASVILSTILTTQPPADTTSNYTAESISPPKSDSPDISQSQ